MGGRLGKFVWVCMLAVTAFATLGIGVIDLMKRMRMELEPTQIVLNPSISDAGRRQLVEKVQNNIAGYVYAPVQHTFPNGTTLLQSSAPLKPYEVSSLLAGQSMRVHYDKKSPGSIFRQGDLPQPAGWLIGGMVLAAVAWFAFGLWRKEGEQYEDDY